MRQMAMGKEMTPEMARRVEMEQNRYETRSAKEMVRSLETSLYNTDNDGNLIEKENFTVSDAEELFKQLADIEGRIRLSDERKVDLISYSDFAKVEQERLGLDVAAARAKVELRRLVDELSAKGEIDLGGESAQSYVALELNKRREGLVLDNRHLGIAPSVPWRSKFPIRIGFLINAS
jgi:hypothetical protein